MRQIPLTKGCVALVDDRDYDALMSMGPSHAVREAPDGVAGPPRGKHTWYAARHVNTPVSRRPHAAKKAGAGIKHFTVEPATHGTRCFYITRADGSKTDFSYFKCV